MSVCHMDFLSYTYYVKYMYVYCITYVHRYHNTYSQEYTLKNSMAAWNHVIYAMCNTFFNIAESTVLICICIERKGLKGEPVVKRTIKPFEELNKM